MDTFEAVETRSDNHVGGWVTTTDATKIWVDIHGTGRPVVLVHGWTMSAAFWRRQIALADHCQVITVDLRGHGKSPAVLRGNTISRYARDIRDTLRALGLSKVMLIGWSLGGAVVTEYWRQFGNDMISGLGLVETGPAPMSSAPWNLHSYRDHNVKALEADLTYMAKNRQTFGEAFINAMFLSGTAPQHAFAWMLREQLKVATETATAIYEDYVQRDYTSVLPTITVPTLAVYGRSKHMCFGPSTGRFVAGSIPNSQFAILENSGHLPFYEEPDLFNDRLKQFLKQLS